MDLPMVANDMGYRIDLTINKKSSECMKETVNPTIINIRSDMKVPGFSAALSANREEQQKNELCHPVAPWLPGRRTRTGRRIPLVQT